jgi:hypothetical protein
MGALMRALTASARYNDWDGTVAADNVEKGLIHFLETKGLLDRKSEFVVGVELSVPETSTGKGDAVSMKALVVCTASYDDAARRIEDRSNPLPLKNVELDVSLDEFLKLFRRFNLVLTRRGLKLNGREIESRE